MCVCVVFVVAITIATADGLPGCKYCIVNTIMYNVYFAKKRKISFLPTCASPPTSCCVAASCSSNDVTLSRRNLLRSRCSSNAFSFPIIRSCFTSPNYRTWLHVINNHRSWCNQCAALNHLTDHRCNKMVLKNLLVWIKKSDYLTSAH